MKKSQTLFESQDQELIVTRPADHCVHMRLKGDEDVLSVSYNDVIPSVWIATNYTQIIAKDQSEQFTVAQALEWKHKAQQLDNLRDALGLKVTE